MNSYDEPFQINSGVGLSKFKLGMSINETIEYLTKEFPRVHYDLTIGDYTTQESSELQLCIPCWGVRLRYLPLSQKLFIIDIYDLKCTAFEMNDTVIHDTKHKTTLKSLQNTLGPLFPGKFVEDGLYLLQFDGISLLFSIPTQFQSIYENGNKIPTLLPDDSSALLKRVYVHPSDLEMEGADKYSDDLPLVAEIVFKRRSNSPDRPLSHVHFKLPGSQKDGLVTLGMSAQDVISNLGNPDFASSASQRSDSYSQRYEYYRLGLDLYFSKKRHLVYRIVMRTNFPGHQDFSRYDRCAFRINDEETADRLICARSQCSILSSVASVPAVEGQGTTEKKREASEDKTWKAASGKKSDISDLEDDSEKTQSASETMSGNSSDSGIGIDVAGSITPASHWSRTAVRTEILLYFRNACTGSVVSMVCW